MSPLCRAVLDTERALARPERTNFELAYAINNLSHRILMAADAGDTDLVTELTVEMTWEAVRLTKQLGGDLDTLLRQHGIALLSNAARKL